MPRIIEEEADDALRSFIHLGLDPQRRSKSKEATADCPFCGKEGKFSVQADTSEWHCWSCGSKGNALGFLRQLHAASEQATSDYDELVADRRLLSAESLIHWGAVRSLLTGEWLLPGHSPEGKLDQLYRWCRVPAPGGRWAMRVIPTPGIWGPGESHALHGLDAFDPTRRDVLICEGFWDGVAAWEVVSKLPTDKHSMTVLAVPGCEVFREGWAKLLAGKRIFVAFDNDHPRLDKAGQVREVGALAGLKRLVALLSGGDEPPVEIRCLWWGPGDSYHEPALLSGHDVRDVLSKGKTLEQRAVLFEQLLGKMRPAPRDWLRERGSVKKDGATLAPLPCRTWAELADGWEKALRMRQGLFDVLAVMVAVAVSTSQLGDQLFLQVIGAAGSAKSRLCEGLLVSKGCKLLEHLTGFHSGYNDGTGKDFSLLARINHKCLVTPEFDVLMQSPRFNELMSQQRRIFDGSSGATYKTKDEDVRYVGLRTPWIGAGTFALLDTDQARLGDRFLRVCMDEPDADERQAILRRVGHSALQSVVQTSDGVAERQVEQTIGRAYRLTGGYVDHLRANVSRLLADVTSRMDDEAVIDRCAALAEWTALMRAKPHPDPKKRDDAEVGAELPTRLNHQFVRLAVCLAAVLNKETVDADVMRIIRRVALDTARGRTSELVAQLAQAGTEGMSLHAVALTVGRGEQGCRTNLHFLERIGVVESHSRLIAEGMSTQVKWRLTPKIVDLWLEVMRDAEDRP